MSHFPSARPRRLRQSPGLRRLVRETTLSVDDLILPVFLVPGCGVRREIETLPGIFHLSVDQLQREAEEALRLGIPAVILFGLPAHKDSSGSEAYAPDGVVQQGIRALKAAAPDLVVISDVCLCEYTDHGHCGILRQQPQRCHGKCLQGLCVDNDESLAYLSRVAVSHAVAGVDIVAPSDMMDGRVRAIRSALDQEGHDCVGILSYSAKYASAFYGPFRVAAGSAPQLGDRSSYQMDMHNAREALREIAMDVEEGADMVMVKPALTCLDIIARARPLCDLPLVAYSVSGEYCAIKAAAARGWLDERRCAFETLTAIKRAGADAIITYWAKDVARWLRADPTPPSLASPEHSRAE